MDGRCNPNYDIDVAGGDVVEHKAKQILIFAETLIQPWDPGIVAYPLSPFFVVKCCIGFLCLLSGVQFYCYIFEYEHQPNVLLLILVVVWYSECQKWVYACEVFEERPLTNTIAWNVMMSCCVQNNQTWGALSLFDVMQICELDDVISLLLFQAYAHLNVLEIGERICGCIMKYGYGNVLSLSKFFIYVYTCCGYMDMAYDMLRIGNENVVSWSEMISSLAMSKYGGAAHQYTLVTSVMLVISVMLQEYRSIPFVMLHFSVLAFGLTTIFQRLWVLPREIWWLSNLIQALLFSLISVLHEKDKRPNGGTARTQGFFRILTNDYSCYVVPSHPFSMLTSWLYWLNPKPVLVQQLGFGFKYTGVATFKFDWSTSSSYLGSALANSWFVVAIVGFFLVMQLKTPIFFWLNVYEANLLYILELLQMLQQATKIHGALGSIDQPFMCVGIASNVAGTNNPVDASIVFGTFVILSLMDRQGRKSLPIACSSGMAAGLKIDQMSSLTIHGNGRSCINKGAMMVLKAIANEELRYRTYIIEGLGLYGLATQTFEFSNEMCRVGMPPYSTTFTNVIHVYSYTNLAINSHLFNASVVFGSVDLHLICCDSEPYYLSGSLSTLHLEDKVFVKGKEML